MSRAQCCVTACLAAPYHDTKFFIVTHPLWLGRARTLPLAPRAGRSCCGPLLAMSIDVSRNFILFILFNSGPFYPKFLKQTFSRTYGLFFLDPNVQHFSTFSIYKEYKLTTHIIHNPITHHILFIKMHKGCMI